MPAVAVCIVLCMSAESQRLLLSHPVACTTHAHHRAAFSREHICGCAAQIGRAWADLADALRALRSPDADGAVPRELRAALVEQVAALHAVSTASQVTLLASGFRAGSCAPRFLSGPPRCMLSPQLCR